MDLFIWALAPAAVATAVQVRGFWPSPCSCGNSKLIVLIVICHTVWTLSCNCGKKAVATAALWERTLYREEFVEFVFYQFCSIANANTEFSINKALRSIHTVWQRQRLFCHNYMKVFTRALAAMANNSYNCISLPLRSCKNRVRTHLLALPLPQLLPLLHSVNKCIRYSGIQL